MPDTNGLRRPFDDLENLYTAALRDVSGEIGVEGVGKPMKVLLSGEILVYARQEGTLFNIERVRRVALIGRLLDPKGNPEIHADLGIISLAGPLAPVSIDKAAGEISDLKLQLHYSALTEQAPPLFETSHVHYPHQERIAGNLEWRNAGPPHDRGIPLSIQITLKLHEERKHLGRILSLTIPWNSLDFLLTAKSEPALPLGAGDSPLILGDSAQGLKSYTAPTDPSISKMKTQRRTLRLRFFDFTKDSLGDLVVACNSQIDGAYKVWCKCAALDLSVEPQITLGTEQERKTYHQFGSAFPERTGGTLNVYIVDEFTTAQTGGGNSYDLATGGCFCVLCYDSMAGNPYLLAHELGHAFGLPHPNGDDGAIPKTTTDIYSSPGSIMEADTPNPEYNTYYNCWIFTYQPSSPLPPEAACPPGPMVQTTFVDGQPVDGYIRPTPPYYVFSYAGDVGSEPLASPNWWQNPDIWNRRSNTSGGGRAAHEIPDKNSEENYLYVRITRQTRLSVPVTVQLFMMEKGIDTKLYSIGQIEFARTETTAPAAGYTDLSLKWSPKSAVAVLSDHNTDHCICAVISHIDEPPLNNTVTASWMHSRAGIYRGLAQRNLGDITISLSASSLGSAADGASLPTSTPHRIHLPWVQFVNPFEQSYPTEVIVDATQATDLSDLTIEIDGDGWHESLAPGTVNNVAFDKQMEPSARLVLRLSATIPPGLPAGSEMVIDLRFTLDGQVIGGYTHIIRVGSLEEATVQVLERLAGVLQHLASAFTLELATSAAKSIKRIIRSYGTQPERALEALRRRAGSIRDLANAIYASPEPEAVIIQRGLFELAGLVASAGQGIDPEQMLERIRGLVDRIQEPTGQVARRQQLAQAGNSEALVERPQRKFRVLKAE